jgi:hypothetical protein
MICGRARRREMPNRLQFSIVSIFVATTAAASAIAAVVAEPSWLSLLALYCVNTIFAVTAVISATETEGKLKIFWIGVTLALAPSLVMQGVSIGWVLPHQGFASTYAGLEKMAASSANGVRFTLAAIWCLSIPNGLLAVLIYSLFYGRRHK